MAAMAEELSGQSQQLASSISFFKLKAQDSEAKTAPIAAQAVLRGARTGKDAPATKAKDKTLPSDAAQSAHSHTAIKPASPSDEAFEEF
jgi:hypothetical protein